MAMEEFASFLKHIEQQPEYRGQIVHQRTLPVKPASYGVPNSSLSDGLLARLEAIGVSNLYTHQVEAFDLVKEGKNVLVVSGTASGKSLCYNVPVLEEMLANKKARALYLFPTKALAQDQLRALRELDFPGLAATYDGDTPREERTHIRRRASVVLSNPDMLHYSILPSHKQWASFFLNLKYVIVDEIHALRGVFGSNVAQVIRRLRRLCHYYGSHPQFIMASATVANPGELAERLVGLDVEVVTSDGAPRGQKTWIFWNPPFVDESMGRRKSPNRETTWLLSELSKEHFRTIAFSKSRKLAELVLNYSGRFLDGHPDIAKRIASYRGGYLPTHRRMIEERLFSGELLGVSTTNALELGIDIGALDTCIMNGFPGTISSTWQQAGRAGRTVGESLAVLVAGGDPLDQYYINHPEYFFGRSFEEAIIDLDNPKILGSHLRCAAYELPLGPNDRFYFGEGYEATLNLLTATGELKERKLKWFLGLPGFPARETDIRSASQSNYDIVDKDTGQLIGTTEANRAFFEIYPGAIYLHQGDPYIVQELDIKEQVAHVEKSSQDYYTEPREEITVTVMSEIERRKLGGTELCFGQVEVTTYVIAFQKKRSVTQEVIGIEELDLPPVQFQTEAIWFTMPDGIIGELKLNEYELAGGIHAVEHAGIAMLPMYAMCDRWDIGGVSIPLHYYTGQATVFIYDGFEGGIGIAQRGFWVAEEHLRRTLEIIEMCPCQDGCPSCIQSPKCGNWNEPLDKKSAIRILRELLKGAR
ncbi:MAG: DEAD/DEAH box helicase [Actinobacteria bacterium]|nr:DEAD/DEAH box helicase [Actinomycetota bacterium]